MAKKAAAPKKPTAVQIQARLKNPGERAKLDVKYLTPAQRAQRDMNTRLNAPVTQGSSLTNRDVARQADTATKLQYGASEQGVNSNIAARQQTEKDASDWYTAYQNDLKAHAANIAGQGQATTTNLNNLTAAAAATSAPGGTATPDDQNAARVRALLTGSFAGLANQTATNANTYADTQANVVAPGQKLSALLNARKDTQSVRDKLSALKSEEGQFNQKYRSDAADAEAKNVLATSIATGKSAADQAAITAKAKVDAANIDIRRGVDPVTGKAIKKAPSPTAEKTKADLAYFKIHGYYPPTGPPKSPKKTGKSGKGPDWVTPGQASSFQTDFDRAKAYAKQLLADPHRSRAQIAAALQSTSDAATVYDTKTGKRKLNPDGTPVTTGSWAGVSSAVTSAAIDYAQSGHLSAYTVRKLIAAGIKPSSLGVPTAGQLKTTRGAGHYSKGSGRPD